MTKQMCMHCTISGKVQGVWYRASAKEQAKRLGLTGWARNLTDGRVDVIACGDETQLKTFYAWLQEGPEHAIVTDCSRDNLMWKEYPEFSIF